MRILVTIALLCIGLNASAQSYTGQARAQSFVGDGSNISSTTVAASSAPAANANIASVADVIVATVTATFRGGRPFVVSLVSTIHNAAGATRTYTIKLLQDGAAITPTYTQDQPATSFEVVDVDTLDADGTTAGSHTFTATMASSSATGTQTAESREIYVQEF